MSEEEKKKSKSCFKVLVQKEGDDYKLLPSEYVNKRECKNGIKNIMKDLVGKKIFIIQIKEEICVEVEKIEKIMLKRLK